ncbi:MAG: ADP-ribosylglycohydrolase family protein [Ilumatobacteraceae bacterium]
MTTHPLTTIPTCDLAGRRRFTDPESQRALGAAIGAAVADALGAPFEFGAPGRYSARFPEPLHGTQTEMIGGGGFGWAPGEFTDDTQMAILLGESLATCGGYDPDHLWASWQDWARDAADVGITTRRALGYDDWRTVVHADPERTAANGALMRSVLLAVALFGQDDAVVRDVVVHQSALTHHHLDAGWGAWIAVAAVQEAIGGGDPFARIDREVADLPAEARDRFAPMLDAAWHPSLGGPSNGSVWGCLAQAVWAARHHPSFDGAVIAAIDLGGDTDTVATVAGAIAGAMHGIQAVPARWTTVLNGRLPGGRTLDLDDVTRLVRRLMGKSWNGRSADEAAAGPMEVAPGLYAANILGAVASPSDWAVVSMCATEDLFDDRTSRRQVYIKDDPGDANLSLMHPVRDIVDSIDAFLAEGKQVVVHCHGGHSRTGLALRAWYMRANSCTEEEAHEWLTPRWPGYTTWQSSFTEFLRTEWITSDYGRN